MILNCYSIYDVNMGYLAPVVQDNDAVAMRNFENACCDKSSIFHTHCGDFLLFCVGSFDTSTGDLVACEPRKICHASDFVVNLRED